MASSSPDDSDIDAIISEATDACILEQIAALNTAHLPDSSLPPDLESRFRKLKTFPDPNTRSSPKEKENTPSSAASASTSKPENSPSSERKSTSPTHVMCCFGCSAKKMSRRTKAEGFCEDRFFIDFGVSSMKEQRRKLGKVLKEQEKASREADRMAEVIELAIARMNADALDVLVGGLGDQEEFN